MELLANLVWIISFQKMVESAEEPLKHLCKIHSCG